MSISTPILPMLPANVDECIMIGAESGLSHWSREAFLTELARPDVIAIVAEAGAHAAGFIIGRVVIAEQSGEIYNLGVKTDFKRQGIGRDLLRAFEAQCRKHIVNTIWLEVRSSNSAAISFYRQNGFIEMSVRKGFYSAPAEDAVVMRKII